MAIFPTPLDDEAVRNVIALHGLYRDYVKNEDSLINYRTTWLITLQSVLFTIYGFTIQKKAEILADIAKLLVDASHDPRTRAADTAKAAADTVKALDAIINDPSNQLGSSISLLGYVIDWTPILGIITCVSCIVSIYAAYRTCSEVELRAAAHTQIFTDISLPGITGGGAFGTSFLGSIISFFIPLIMLCFWFFARFIISHR